MEEETWWKSFNCMRAVFQQTFPGGWTILSVSKSLLQMLPFHLQDQFGLNQVIRVYSMTGSSLTVMDLIIFCSEIRRQKRENI